MNVAVITALLLTGCVEAQAEPVKCIDVPTRLKVRSTMLDALDASLKESITKTFGVWMADSKDQPERAYRGMKNAVNAYLEARDTVWEWDPPICEQQAHAYRLQSDKSKPYKLKPRNHKGK